MSHSHLLIQKAEWQIALASATDATRSVWRWMATLLNTHLLCLLLFSHALVNPLEEWTKWGYVSLESVILYIQTNRESMFYYQIKSYITRIIEWNNRQARFHYRTSSHHSWQIDTLPIESQNVEFQFFRLCLSMLEKKYSTFDLFWWLNEMISFFSASYMFGVWSGKCYVVINITWLDTGQSDVFFFMDLLHYC